MNEILTSAAHLSTAAALYVLLVGGGNRRLAWTLMFTANVALLFLADGTMPDQLLRGSVVLLAVAGYTAETRQVRS